VRYKESMDTTQPVQIVHIPAYMWDDIVDLFPEDFANVASDALGDSDMDAFGDAEYTIIKGTLATRILFDAWDGWDGAEEHDRNEVFARLPSLINALVALRG
jgi:hypothetical protein